MYGIEYYLRHNAALVIQSFVSSDFIIFILFCDSCYLFVIYRWFIIYWFLHLIHCYGNKLFKNQLVVVWCRFSINVHQPTMTIKDHAKYDNDHMSGFRDAAWNTHTHTTEANSWGISLVCFQTRNFEKFYPPP